MGRKKRERVTYALTRVAGSPFWYIAWTENRKPKRVSTRTAEREAAEDILANFRAGSYAAPEHKEVTVSMALQEYRTAKQKDGSAYGTIANALQPIEDYFGRIKLDNVTPALSREYTAQRKKDGRANGTILRELSTMRSAINYCIKEGWKISAPPIILPPPSRARERWLTKDEIKRLIAECKEDHLRLFVVMAYTTCARKGSILELTWDRVDMKNRLIEFMLPDAEQTSKRRGVKRINNLLYPMLERALELAQSDYVIEWCGKPLMNLHRSFMTAAKATGLKGKVTPHVLKHSAGVHMAMDGVPLWEICQMMDHTSVRTTERHYLKFHPDFQEKASKTLEKL